MNAASAARGIQDGQLHGENRAFYRRRAHRRAMAPIGMAVSGRR